MQKNGMLRYKQQACANLESSTKPCQAVQSIAVQGFRMQKGRPVWTPPCMLLTCVFKQAFACAFRTADDDRWFAW